MHLAKGFRRALLVLRDLLLDGDKLAVAFPKWRAHRGKPTDHGEHRQLLQVLPAAPTAAPADLVDPSEHVVLPSEFLLRILH